MPIKIEVYDHQNVAVDVAVQPQVVAVNPTLGSGLPNVSSADNGKILQVVHGAWKPANPPQTGADGLTTTSDSNGNDILYLTKEGEIIGEGIVLPSGGGTGGGSSNNAVLTVTNNAGWISKTIAEGADCNIVFAWSSIENDIPTGNGTFTLSVGGALKTSYEITQGEHTINIGKYISAGTNKVLVEIGDIYGNSRLISYTVNAVSISIDSFFDGTIAYTGDIPFGYTPTGAVDKKVYFLVDGNEIATRNIAISGREVSFTIPAQAHGSHTFEVYFTADIDGNTVESNHLFYDLICYEEGRSDPVISVPIKSLSVKQYSTVALPYVVYTPNILTSVVDRKSVV